MTTTARVYPPAILEDTSCSRLSCGGDATGWLWCESDPIPGSWLCETHGRREADELDAVCAEHWHFVEYPTCAECGHRHPDDQRHEARR